jgi:hypothetical protein
MGQPKQMYVAISPSSSFSPPARGFDLDYCDEYVASPMPIRSPSDAQT